MTKAPLPDSAAKRALAIVAAIAVAFVALVAPPIALLLGLFALGALAVREPADGVR